MEKVEKLAELKGHKECYVISNGITDTIRINSFGRLKEQDVIICKKALLKDLQKWLKVGKLYRA